MFVIFRKSDHHRHHHHTTSTTPRHRDPVEEGRRLHLLLESLQVAGRSLAPGKIVIIARQTFSLSAGCRGLLQAARRDGERKPGGDGGGGGGQGGGGGGGGAGGGGGHGLKHLQWSEVCH